MLTKTQLAKVLADEMGLKKSQIIKLLESLNAKIIGGLKTDQKFKLAGLGIFVVKDRAARMGRNPKTGEAVQIPAKRVVKFRVAKDLKKSVL